MTCQTCHTETPDNICTGCEKQTDNRLRDIPRLQTILSSDPWNKLPRHTTNDRPQRSPTTGAPADLHILSLLDHRTDAGATITPHLQAIRHLIGSTTKLATDTPNICNQMRQLLPWAITNYPDISTLINDIRLQHNLLHRAITGTAPPAKTKCPTNTAETGPCPGNLHLQADSTITCDTCTTTWHTTAQRHDIINPVLPTIPSKK